MKFLAETFFNQLSKRILLQNNKISNEEVDETTSKLIEKIDQNLWFDFKLSLETTKELINHLGIDEAIKTLSNYFSNELGHSVEFSRMVDKVEDEDKEALRVLLNSGLVVCLGAYYDKENFNYDPELLKFILENGKKVSIHNLGGLVETMIFFNDLDGIKLLFATNSEEVIEELSRPDHYDHHGNKTNEGKEILLNTILRRSKTMNIGIDTDWNRIKEFTQLLLDYGSDINAVFPQYWNQTLLEILVLFKEPEPVEIALSLGAKVTDKALAQASTPEIKKLLNSD